MPSSSKAQTERSRVDQACRTAGIDAGELELLSLGDSATFRVGDEFVARVTRSAAQQSTAHREIAIARWLETAGLPAITAAADPVDDGPYTVTFWHHRPDLRSATPAEIAQYLLQLHALAPPADVDLQNVQPFVSISARVDAADIPDGDKQFLRSRLGELTDKWETVTFELPATVIHGDPHPDNVVATPDGTVLILDLERFSFGPPEWDLTLMASEYGSFRWITTQQYRQYADTYGYDVLAAPAYPVLRDIRELRMTSWLANKADQHPNTRTEALHRIACLRGDHGPRPWTWDAG
ncbi:aminoglycoside phosphotransferase family protein [Kribbella qitaiheensis]|uniref:Aminoglycoside phosphotransferase family protein n=1 Tax=Kribbella qitaiheensis TaxID=1544730 RepID=A0A7G6WW40_9ACTN|nr:aminoglycoside phosphotransferase family protein [Kribbella qitaiheensis]QNE18205.1 aminoglycoside phosphotransferase family protein [Kribbella qitaiheensis]